MNQTRGETPANTPPVPPFTPDLRMYLQQEFLRRCRTNPRYSLRAFARALKLESSYLSKILQGKREVTTRLVSRVQEPLKLSAQQVELSLVGQNLLHDHHAEFGSPAARQEISRGGYVKATWTH